MPGCPAHSHTPGSAPSCTQAVTRLKTYNDNVNSVLGFYRDVTAKVLLVLCALQAHAFTRTHPMPADACGAPGHWLLRTSASKHVGQRHAQVDGTGSMDDVFVAIEKIMNATVNTSVREGGARMRGRGHACARLLWCVLPPRSSTPPHSQPACCALSAGPDGPVLQGGPQRRRVPRVR